MHCIRNKNKVSDGYFCFNHMTNVLVINGRKFAENFSFGFVLTRKFHAIFLNEQYFLKFSGSGIK